MTCIVRGPSPSLSTTCDLILATTKTKINNLQVIVVLKKYIKDPLCSKYQVKSFNEFFRWIRYMEVQCNLSRTEAFKFIEALHINLPTIWGRKRNTLGRTKFCFVRSRKRSDCYRNLTICMNIAHSNDYFVFTSIGTRKHYYNIKRRKSCGSFNWVVGL